eukprot:TRINITY_DN17541_c0_g1_i1.p1 TRINITY_DN17541_c0_g1~~TRINITY_DN17541_c0_g1_i1.p1  ORF type:complete len:104 (+),score=5.98 TRINITY_DN17541_c0_g1_i1:176-487(+)
MSNNDRTLGYSLLFTSLSVYLYYAFWVLLTPFIDEDHFIQSYFPDRTWAILVPIAVVITLAAATSAFLGITMVYSRTVERRAERRAEEEAMHRPRELRGRISR